MFSLEFLCVPYKTGKLDIFWVMWLKYTSQPVWNLFEIDWSTSFSKILMKSWWLIWQKLLQSIKSEFIKQWWLPSFNNDAMDKYLTHWGLNKFGCHLREHLQIMHVLEKNGFLIQILLKFVLKHSNDIIGTKPLPKPIPIMPHDITRPH